MTGPLARKRLADAAGAFLPPAGRAQALATRGVLCVPAVAGVAATTPELRAPGAPATEPDGG